MAVAVVAYTTNWCPDCTRSKRVLGKLGVQYDEIDIEKIEGAEDVMRGLNGGSGKVPTIIIQDGDERIILIEPSDRELTKALCDHSATANQTAPSK